MAGLNMEPNEQLIAQVPLLARLSTEDIRALAARGRTRRHEAGAVIFREGDPGDSLHTVIEGSVRIAVASAAGDEATLAMLGPGDCFGELALLDGRPRSAGAVAASPARTLVVSRDAFVEWLRERPAAALALLETLSLRLRETDQSLADRTFLDLPQRLAKRLVELVRAHPEVHAPSAGDGLVHLRVTQANLAAMLGVSRESVNKQLSAFGREGWVSMRRGRVIVHDVAALRALT